VLTEEQIKAMRSTETVGNATDEQIERAAERLKRGIERKIKGREY
jgi:hypothetical protein